MAVEGKLTIEIVHKGLEGVGGSSASEIANELTKALKGNDSVSKNINNAEPFTKVTQGLEVLNQSLKGMVEKQDLSKERLFGQYKQSQASYDVNSANYTLGSKSQQDAKSFMDNLGKQIKTWDDFSKATDSQIQETRKFTETMKNANRDMRSPASSSVLGKMNYFNLSELLMAASARSATGYLTAGAAYQQGLIGTSGSALSNLQVSTDIAQRNSISGAVQAALPAIGMALGSVLGPVGYLGGAALGYAASLPVSMMTAARNAGEAQALTVQSQGAMVNLFGGGNSGSNKNTELFGTGGMGFSNLNFSTNSGIASLIQSGQGYLTGPYAASAIALNRYGHAGMANDPNFLKTMGAYIASTGEDPNQLASSIAFLSAKTGMGPTDVLTMLANVGSVTGQTASDAGSQLSYLTSQTALSSPGSAASFMMNTASYGPAFQNTAMAYQGAGFQTKIAMNAIGGAYGINVEKLMSGDGAQRNAFMHMVHQQNSRGNIEGVGMGDIMGQIMLQGAPSFYSVMDAAGGGRGGGGHISAQDIQQNAPAAYQQATQSAQNMQVTATNVQIVGSKMNRVAQGEMYLMTGDKF